MTIEQRSHQIFASAEFYHEAAFILNQAHKIEVALPAIVNAALALELYFKSLFALEMGREFKVNGRHSHDFNALYLQLVEFR